MLRQKSRTIILSLTILAVFVIFVILVAQGLITSYPPYYGNPALDKALDKTASSVIITNSAVARQTTTAQAR